MGQFGVRIPGGVEERVRLIRKGYLAKAVIRVYGGIGGGNDQDEGGDV